MSFILCAKHKYSQYDVIHQKSWVEMLHLRTEFSFEVDLFSESFDSFHKPGRNYSSINLKVWSDPQDLKCLEDERFPHADSRFHNRYRFVKFPPNVANVTHLN